MLRNYNLPNSFVFSSRGCCKCMKIGDNLLLYMYSTPIKLRLTFNYNSRLLRKYTHYNYWRSTLFYHRLRRYRNSKQIILFDMFYKVSKKRLLINIDKIQKAGLRYVKLWRKIWLMKMYTFWRKQKKSVETLSFFFTLQKLDMTKIYDEWFFRGRKCDFHSSSHA